MAHVTVDIDINDFEDDELVEELESRGYNVSKKVIDNFSDVIEYLEKIRVPAATIEQVKQYKPFTVNLAQQKKWLETCKAV